MSGSSAGGRRRVAAEALAAAAGGLLLAGALGGGSGVLAAGLHHSLRWATAARLQHPWATWALPFIGLAVGLLLEHGGARTMKPTMAAVIQAWSQLGASAGPPPRMGWRLGPQVALGTVLTHLGGASAGREGAAVVLSTWFAHHCGLPAAVARHRPVAWVAGVAGGFAGLFGCPLAAALFPLELVAVGGRRALGLLPASLVAASASGAVALALGVHRLAPAAAAAPRPTMALSPADAWRWGLLAAAVVVSCRGFIALTEAVRAGFGRLGMPLRWRLPAMGLALAAAASTLPIRECLGLSEPLLDRALGAPGAPWAPGGIPLWTPVAKLVLTALTVGAGFVGGEVTPLFVAGACLGHGLAPWLQLPGPLAAGVGLVAMFGCAARMPLVAVAMAAELLGPAALPAAALTCACCALVPGSSIYPRRGGSPAA